MKLAANKNATKREEGIWSQKNYCLTVRNHVAELNSTTKQTILSIPLGTQMAMQHTEGASAARDARSPWLAATEVGTFTWMLN